MQEIHCIVSGRVQMVLYRDFAQRKARGLGLAGYVKNLPEGTVEVMAQGEHEALESLVAQLQRGPMFSRVDDVHVVWHEPRERFEGFRIVH